MFGAASMWSPSFLNYLESSGRGDAVFGYELTDVQHADELPWTNLNEISVRFSEDVNIWVNALNLYGRNMFSHSGMLSYDPTTFTATWLLASGVFSADKLLIVLDSALVTDVHGQRLGGEWTNPLPHQTHLVEPMPSPAATAAPAVTLCFG